MRRYDFRAGTAIVTGAAGGIGEQTAYQLARRGSALALVDRDADRLAAVADRARALGGRPVATYVADLADADATRELGEALVAAHPDAGLLINNAGVALGGTFDQVSAEEFDWLMAVNLDAVVTLTRHLLPTLRRNPGSHLVNVSSVFGLIAPPGNVAYSTSKFAVRGFTEGLRAELAGEVGVTVVHPGGIRTGIAANARIPASLAGPEAEAQRKDFGRLLTYPPEKAAAQIVAAVDHRRPRVLIALSARIPDMIVRITPSRFPALLAALHKRGPGRG